MSVDLSIDRDTGRADILVLTLRGELDYSSYEAVIDAARSAYNDGVRHLVLDLSGVDYMGSSGLVALHSAALLFEGKEPPDPEAGWSAYHSLADDEVHAAVKLLNPSPAVDRVLERTGMKQFFEIHDDRSAAIASF
jgi:anti-anti-sigma regulatory factor